MNFINDRELALRFRNNEVPEREKFLYFVAITFLGYVLTSSAVVAPVYAGGMTKWTLAEDFLFIAIAMAGTVICYRTNQNGDGKQFIERIVCIGFPVAIRATIIFILIGIAYYTALAFILADELAEGVSVYDLPITAAFMGYLYWRLNASIGLAAGSTIPEGEREKAPAQAHQDNL